MGDRSRIREGSRGGAGQRTGDTRPVNDRWHAFFPRFYAGLRWLDPLIAAWWRRFGVGNTLVLEVEGRRTGIPRRVFLGLLVVGDRRYLGHPDGACAWTLNLDAAGGGRLLRPGRAPERVAASPLPAGPEREAVIKATFRQHPFPGNVLYWLARRHVREVGTYYRIEPVPGAAGAPPEGSEPGRSETKAPSERVAEMRVGGLDHPADQREPLVEVAERALHRVEGEPLHVVQVDPERLREQGELARE